MALPRFEKLDEPRKRSILAAAAEEFGERGFAGASYNHIIERAGISKGAMYYYFADKDDLFRTVLDEALRLWIAAVGIEFVADDEASFWSACRDTYARSLRFMLADPTNAALCLSVTRARERMEGHPALVLLQHRMRELLEAILRQGQEVGAVRADLPPDLILHVGLSIMDAGDRWLAEHWDELRPEAVDEIADRMVDLFRRVGAP